MLLLPTRMPRKMKIVKGFQGLRAGWGVVVGEERMDLGMREVQNVGWATFGRGDSGASRARGVAEKDRGWG